MRWMKQVGGWVGGRHAMMEANGWVRLEAEPCRRRHPPTAHLSAHTPLPHTPLPHTRAGVTAKARDALLAGLSPVKQEHAEASAQCDLLLPSELDQLRAELHAAQQALAQGLDDARRAARQAEEAAERHAGEAARWQRQQQELQEQLQHAQQQQQQLLQQQRGGMAAAAGRQLSLLWGHHPQAGAAPAPPAAAAGNDGALALLPLEASAGGAVAGGGFTQLPPPPELEPSPSKALMMLAARDPPSAGIAERALAALPGPAAALLTAPGVREGGVPPALLAPLVALGRWLPSGPITGGSAAGAIVEEHLRAATAIHRWVRVLGGGLRQARERRSTCARRWPSTGAHVRMRERLEGGATRIQKQGGLFFVPVVASQQGDGPTPDLTHARMPCYGERVRACSSDARRLLARAEEQHASLRHELAQALRENQSLRSSNQELRRLLEQSTQRLELSLLSSSSSAGAQGLVGLPAPALPGAASAVASGGGASLRVAPAAEQALGGGALGAVATGSLGGAALASPGHGRAEGVYGGGSGALHGGGSGVVAGEASPNTSNFHPSPSPPPHHAQQQQQWQQQHHQQGPPASPTPHQASWELQQQQQAGGAAEWGGAATAAAVAAKAALAASQQQQQQSFEGHVGRGYSLELREDALGVGLGSGLVVPQDRPKGGNWLGFLFARQARPKKRVRNELL